jgi:hypothetical protein
MTQRWWNSHPRQDHLGRLNECDARLAQQGRQDLFDKQKCLPKIEPSSDISMRFKRNLFTSDRWHLMDLIHLKNKLNDTRNRLNEKDIQIWKQHTRRTNMTGNIVRSLRRENHIEMCTNAWIKMAEIFSKYHRLIPSGELNRTAFDWSSSCRFYHRSKWLLSVSNSSCL